MFYSGFGYSSTTELESTAPEISKFVLFSQVVEKTGDEFSCYQKNDPTSEIINDVLDTDGGYIKIAEADRIVAMRTIGNVLVVFANNGVWAIRGSEEGFSATNFQVTKVSNVGCIAPQSVVVTDNGLFYTARSGIYVVGLNEAFDPEIQNLTETSIQSKYLNIPNEQREHMIGFYEEEERRVRWLYPDNTNFEANTANSVLNKELVFDLVLGAFYENSITNTATKFLSSYLKLPTTSNITVVANVITASGDTVIHPTGGVIVDVTGRNATTDSFLMIGRNGASMFFGGFTDSAFVDFGADSYDSFLETGYISEGDSSRRKQATYLICHFNRTETGFITVGGELEAENPSGCLVQARWGYSDELIADALDSGSGQFGKVYDPVTGKWVAGGFQAYRYTRDYVPQDVNDDYEYGKSVITTKSKLRGQGEALRIRFYNDGDKDFQLLGWALPLSASGRV
jgi:hypothetical protein